MDPKDPKPEKPELPTPPAIHAGLYSPARTPDQLPDDHITKRKAETPAPGGRPSDNPTQALVQRVQRFEAATNRRLDALEGASADGGPAIAKLTEVVWERIAKTEEAVAAKLDELSASVNALVEERLDAELQEEPTEKEV